MSIPQLYASALLAFALVMFGWGRWRHDIVALLVLLLAVAGGLVPAAAAFSGFGHPAVITVIAVLILSYALESTGAIGAVAKRLAIDQPSLGRQVALYCALGAVLSAFVNNVGALAMLMPLAIATARRHSLPSSAILMPLAFATMLGGMTTLIGTPPNIIVSTFRRDAGGTPFGLFDFSPVGVAVAAVGLAFLALVGWRLLPRDRKGVETFAEVGEYMAELHLADGAELVGRGVSDVAKDLESRDVQLLGVLRGEEWTPRLTRWARVQATDVLLVQGAPKALAALQGWLGASLGSPEHLAAMLKPADTTLAEVVLRPYSRPIGSTPEELRMRSRYRVNLLGVARQGARHYGTLKSFRFDAGDVLLLQGAPADVADAVAEFDALPLGDRLLEIHRPRAAYLAAGTFAIALVAIGVGAAQPAIAMASAVAVLLVLRVLSPRGAYAALDGSVIVVLGALLPLGQALQTIGWTEMIGKGLLALTGGQPAVVSLALVLVVTMFLSDLINNAATAVVMAPIAASAAAALGVSPDPFLMAVAIGASCAFLTPIGHQNNLLVMGPGGYRFGDYWRVGLPLEVLIAVAAIALLPRVWPFTP